MDAFSDPHHLVEADRARDRVLEQEEWERDDTRVVPHPRPRKPHRASRSEWAETKLAFANYPCQVCGGRSTELHHILARDGDGTWPRGDDYRANLAALCSDCHRSITERDMGVRARLGASLTWVQLDYLRRRVVRLDAYLERHYAEAA